MSATSYIRGYLSKQAYNQQVSAPDSTSAINTQHNQLSLQGQPKNRKDIYNPGSMFATDKFTKGIQGQSELIPPTKDPLKAAPGAQAPTSIPGIPDLNKKGLGANLNTSLDIGTNNMQGIKPITNNIKPAVSNNSAGLA